jgi:hypothetical protein
MKNRLLQRVKALEEIVKPQAVTEIPPAAQAVFDRMMKWKPEPKVPEQFDEKIERKGAIGV